MYLNNIVCIIIVCFIICLVVSTHSKSGVKSYGVYTTYPVNVMMMGDDRNNRERFTDWIKSMFGYDDMFDN